MARDYYEAGKPLSREGLFQLITDEVFKSGHVETWENDLLNRLAGFLKMDPAKARSIAQHSKKKFRRGKLGTPRNLSTALLYERALFFAWSDDHLDGIEDRMLAALRGAFHIDEKTHAALVEKVRSPAYKANEKILVQPPTVEFDLPELPEEEEEDHQAPPPLSQTLRRQRSQELPPLRPSSPAREESRSPAEADGEEEEGRRPVGGPRGAVAMARPGHGGRKAGQKSGTASFGLRPEGVPIPSAVNAKYVGLASVVGLLGFVCITVVANRISNAAFLGAVVLYWWLRKNYEKQMIEPGAKLVVSAERIVLPGPLVGQDRPFVIEKKDVKKLWLGVENKSALGGVSTVKSLNIQLAAGGRIIRFWAGAIDGDIQEIAKAIESYMVKPCGREEHGYHLPPEYRWVAVVFCLAVFAYIAYLILG